MMATGIRETIFMRSIWSFILPDHDVEGAMVKEENYEDQSGEQRCDYL